MSTESMGPSMGQRWIVGVALAALLTGCGAGSAERAAAPGGRERTEETPAAETVAIESRSGDGWRLDAPADWTVEDEGDGTVAVTGTAGERVELRPLFLAGTFGAEGAAALLRRVAEGVPDSSWGAVEQLAGAVRAAGSVGDDDAVATLTWTTVPAGSAGFVAVASAPAWDAAEPAVAGILQSFEVVGPAATEPAGPRYSTWRDPTEGAFTVEIPEGWQASGGMTRPCPVILQGAVEVRSPDGAVYLKYGNDYPYFVNDAAGAQFALGIGDSWPQPCGYQSPVAPYAPGARFVLDHLAPQVPGVEILEVRDRPDLASALNRGGMVSYDAGEVAYRYVDEGGAAVRGLVLSVTEQTTMGAVGTWDVWRIVIAESLEDRYDEAVAAASHLASTFRFDPTWAQAQAQLTAAQSQIMADQSDAVSRTVSEGYWARQRTYDALSERRSMATLGVEDYADPVTGDVHRLDSGPNHWWVDPAGTIVGTETSARPTVDFRELLHLPR